jgi:hypothetical protein
LFQSGFAGASSVLFVLHLDVIRRVGCPKCQHVARVAEPMREDAILLKGGAFSCWFPVQDQERHDPGY